jgi:hypothetical protein
MRDNKKTTPQQQKERYEAMINMYVQLWGKGVSSSLIITKIGNKFFLSDSRVREILRPIKLRAHFNLK